MVGQGRAGIPRIRTWDDRNPGKNHPRRWERAVEAGAVEAASGSGI